METGRLPKVRKIMSSLPVQQIPGIYHRRIGDIVVTAVSDGYIDGNLDLLKNVEVERARAVLVNAFRPVRRVSINAFLLHTKEGPVLIDTGTEIGRASCRERV